MVASAAATGLMIAAGEPAVVVVFGERWHGAGVALVAMSGLNIGSAISVVAQDAIKARGRTRLINWFTLADLFLGVGFLLMFIGPFGLVGASLSISLTSLVAAAIMLGLAQLVVGPVRRVLTVWRRRCRACSSQPPPRGGWNTIFCAPLLAGRFSRSSC